MANSSKDVPSTENATTDQLCVSSVVQLQTGHNRRNMDLRRFPPMKEKIPNERSPVYSIPITILCIHLKTVKNLFLSSSLASTQGFASYIIYS